MRLKSLQNLVSLSWMRKQAAEETVELVRQIPSDLAHEAPMGVGRDPGDCDLARGQLPDEEHVVGPQSTGRPDFSREEVRGRNRLPVSTEERLPRGASLWCGFDTVSPQDVRNGRRGNAMPEVLEGALDLVVAPARDMWSSTYLGLCEAVDYVKLDGQ